MKVLVTGGTGVVGKSAVDHLLRAGHGVRLLSRHAASDARQWSAGVEPHEGSVSSDQAVAGAAEGCDAVLHVAGIVAETPDATFQEVNVEGTRRLVREAKRAGVRRFVYVSSLGAERGESAYHRSKRQAEEVVRAEAAPGWLIVRPGNVYGPGDEVISLLLKMVRTLPAIPLVGTGSQPFQPMWVEDLGQALARAVERDTPRETAVDVAGPDVTTMRETIELLGKITQRTPVLVPVPEFLARAGTQALSTVGIDFPLKEDQITMLGEENVIPDGAVNGLAEVFGVTPTRLGEGLGLLADALPETLPSDGSGSLHRQRYWADIRGSRLTADQLFEVVRTEFYTLAPSGLLEVGAEPGSRTAMEEGATLTLEIPLRGHIQVRCVDASDNTITLVTLEGHPLSGAIRFDVQDAPGDSLRFEVRSFTRSSDLIDRIGMRTIGQIAQRATWRSVVENVVDRSGGTAPDGVQEEEVTLTGQDAEEVEAWVEETVMRFRRTRSPTPGEGRGSA
jgi:nucleoside-diphosphate-sugar epimerase